MTKLHDDHLLPAHGARLRDFRSTASSGRSPAVSRRRRASVGLRGKRGYSLSLVLYAAPLALIRRNPVNMLPDTRSDETYAAVLVPGIGAGADVVPHAVLPELLQEHLAAALLEGDAVGDAVGTEGGNQVLVGLVEGPDVGDAEVEPDLEGVPLGLQNCNGRQH